MRFLRKMKCFKRNTLNWNNSMKIKKLICSSSRMVKAWSHQWQARVDLLGGHIAVRGIEKVAIRKRRVLRLTPNSKCFKIQLNKRIWDKNKYQWIITRWCHKRINSHINNPHFHLMLWEVDPNSDSPPELILRGNQWSENLSLLLIIKKEVLSRSRDKRLQNNKRSTSRMSVALSPWSLNRLMRDLCS